MTRYKATIAYDGTDFAGFQSQTNQRTVQKEIWWKSVNLIKVILDWKHKIVTSLSQDWDTLDNLIKKENWISWVNWSYFCPADYKVCNWINFTDRARIYNNTLYSKSSKANRLRI